MVDTFKYQHSHLLQFIYEANKDGLIDQFEKIKIKGKKIFRLKFKKFLFFRNGHQSKSRTK
jgi:hypothetical protein